MSKYLFIRKSDKAPIYGDTKFCVQQAGTFAPDPAENLLTLSIVDRLNKNLVVDLNKPISYFLKENGSAYTTYAELELACLDFFNVPEAGVARGSMAAVLSDTVDLATPGWIQPRLLAGNIKFTDVAGNTDTWAFDLKEISPMKVKRVWSTGTTANMGIKVIY